MSDPLVPNYKKNVGRLVTDRFDFEDHLTGENFRHNAGQTDLFPVVVVDGYIKETVQDAIAALADVIYSPTIPDATISSKGAIKLAGDITGTADVITVTKIQGKPINTLVPLSGQVLTWNGAAWSPATPANIFSAGEDLGGNNIAQKVIQITGNNLGEVSVPASSFTFTESSIPLFNQLVNTTTDGSNFTIIAQETTAGSAIGGSVLISGGSGPVSGQSGGVGLLLDNLNSYMLQACQLPTGNRVISLFNGVPLNDTIMPADSGDMVLYIKDAVLPPSSGVPADGVIVYSDGGKLYIKQSDGQEVKVGSIPNPSIWGPSDAQTYTYRSKAQSVTNSPVLAFSYNMPDNCAVKIDLIMVGKEVHATNNESLQVNMSAGYSIDNSSGVVAAGTSVIYDSRDTGPSASTWAVPTITSVGTTLEVYTGYNAATVINWMAVVQLTIVEG